MNKINQHRFKNLYKKNEYKINCNKSCDGCYYYNVCNKKTFTEELQEEIGIDITITDFTMDNMKNVYDIEKEDCKDTKNINYKAFNELKKAIKKD